MTDEAAAKPFRIAVCVLTFHRPAGLVRTLRSVAALDRPEGCELSALVVDNASDGSAAAIVESLDWPETAPPLRGVHEPTPGISAARNRTIDEALTQAPPADAIAFLDDDETAAPDWLVAAVAAMRRHAADVVTGPTVSAFETALPPELVDNPVFRPRAVNRDTGLTTAYTGNVLFTLDPVQASGVRFDARFAATGGSDHRFFSQLHAAGAKIVWAADAITTEWQPAERLTAAYVRRRFHRNGFGLSRLALADRTGLRRATASLVQLAKAGVWFAIGCGESLAGVFSPRRRLLGAMHRDYARGLICGVGSGELRFYGPPPDASPSRDPSVP